MMTQKVIKVGNSSAVIIPKQSLLELGLKPGDKVVVETDKKRKRLLVKSSGRQARVSNELLDWTEKFIQRYRPALEALAKK
jgi:putative addiction module antidote